MKFLQIFDVCFRDFPIFVLCYIHPKLAALKIFYSSQKHVIASYTGLPKKMDSKANCESRNSSQFRRLQSNTP